MLPENAQDLDKRAAVWARDYSDTLDRSRFQFGDLVVAYRIAYTLGIEDCTAEIRKKVVENERTE